MSLSDMDDDLALAALLGRGPRDADETALAGVLGRVSALADGPAPVPSAGLAAFLAAQTAPPVVGAAPAVPSRRSRRSLVSTLLPAGLTAKVVLGAAGVAVAGTTSLGAAALVGGDELPPRRPAVVDPAPAVVSEPSPADESGESRRTTPAPTPAVEAHSDGRGSDDERASVRGGGTREPKAERTTRPERPARETGRPESDMDDDRAGRPRATETDRPDSRPTAGADRTPGASQRGQ